MQRILIVSHGYPPEAIAGTEQMAALTVRGLIERGYDVGLFTAWTDPSAPPTDLPINRVWLVPKRPRAALWQDFSQLSKKRFRRALREFQPAVVYFHHTTLLSFDLPLIAHRFGARTVFMAHDFWLACPRSTLLNKDGTVTSLISRPQCARCLALHDHPSAQGRPIIKMIARPWLARRLLHRRDAVEKRLYQSVDVFISPSKTVARVLRQRGVPRRKMKIIPYGRPELSSEPSASPIVRFGFIGNIAPHKGVGWLIDAFQKINRPDVNFTIWGPLNKPAELNNLDGRSNIRYAGPFAVNRTASIYNQIDCLIVPSHWPENQPLVILQAWLTGTPVITANIGGLAELVKHEINGLLYQFNDSADLINQLNRFANESALREQLARGARDTHVATENEHLDQVIRILTD